MLKVYVAGPYSGSPWTEYCNLRKAMRVGALLLLEDCSPLVPHLTFYLEQEVGALGGAIPRDTWLAMDLEWLAAADVMIVLGHSPGVEGEIDFALAREIPVVWIEDWESIGGG